MTGKNLKFNQLIENGNFVNTSGWSHSRISSKTALNNILNCTVDESAVGNLIRLYKTIPVISQHKYLLIAKVKLSVANSCTVYSIRFGQTFNFPVDFSLANTWNEIKSIKTITLASPVSSQYWFLNTTQENKLNVGDVISYKGLMSIDLTYMYGAGNEPTTVAQVESDCASIGHPLTQYQPYTPIE